MKISQAKTVESGNGPWGWIFPVFSVCCDYISFLYFTVWVRSSHCMSCLWILSKIRQLLQTEQNSAPSLKPKHRHTKRYNAIKKGSCNFWSEENTICENKIGAGYEELSVLRWAQYRRNLKVKNSGLIWGQSAYFALNIVGLPSSMILGFPVHIHTTLMIDQNKIWQFLNFSASANLSHWIRIKYINSNVSEIPKINTWTFFGGL